LLEIKIGRKKAKSAHPYCGNDNPKGSCIAKRHAEGAELGAVIIKFDLPESRTSI